MTAAETLPERFQRLTGTRMLGILVGRPVTDRMARSVRWAVAERLLDRADLSRDELIGRLSGLSPHPQPGPFAQDVADAHAQWLQAWLTGEDEDVQEDLRWHLDKALRDLVTPGATR